MSTQAGAAVRREPNPITGLPDGYNARYKTRIIHHRNIGSLRLAQQTFGENRIRLAGGRELCFMGRLTRSDTLVVTFHGANMVARGIRYPRYERVRTFKRTNASFMAFADPTIQFSPDVLLAWYLGDERMDPLDGIEAAVDKAVLKTGAETVVYVGGSGGGYAALRACLRRPGSSAFVESPRVNLGAALPGSMRKFLDTFWSGRSLGELVRTHPERFDLLRMWRDLRADQRVYYLQGIWDPHFLWNDYRLLKAGMGLNEPAGITPDGLGIFALFESPEPKHGPPPMALFERHWQKAMEHFGASASFQAPIR